MIQVRMGHLEWRGCDHVLPNNGCKMKRASLKCWFLGFGTCKGSSGYIFYWLRSIQCVYVKIVNILWCLFLSSVVMFKRCQATNQNSKKHKRRLYGGQKRHLLNLGKYAASLMVVVVSSPGWPMWKLVSMIPLYWQWKGFEWRSWIGVHGYYGNAMGSAVFRLSAMMTKCDA